MKEGSSLTEKVEVADSLVVRLGSRIGSPYIYFSSDEVRKIISVAVGCEKCPSMNGIGILLANCVMSKILVATPEGGYTHRVVFRCDRRSMALRDCDIQIKQLPCSEDINIRLKGR